MPRRTARRWVDKGLAEDRHTLERGWRVPQPRVAARRLPEGVHTREGGLNREALEAALGEMVADPAAATGPRVQAIRLGFELLDAAEAARTTGDPVDPHGDPLEELDRLAEQGQSKIASMLEAGPTSSTSGGRSSA